MGAIRFSDRRFLNTAAAVSLLLGVLLPSFVPAFASAAEITSRSIDMSSSAGGATSVDYTVTFTPTQAAAGYLIDFCSNTSLVGNSCTAPTGMSTSSMSTDTGSDSVTDLTGGNDGGIVTDSLTANTPNTVELTSITNPTVTSGTEGSTFYARIVTYNSVSSSNLPATSSNSTTVSAAGPEDQGGVALAVTNSFQVSGAVLESLAFCVSGSNTDVNTNDNCADTGSTLTSPNLSLGTNEGGTYVLSNQSETPSTGTVYTQLSTNAVNGAVVNLKSNATGCGGLINAENGSDCLAPITSSTFTSANGNAGFGVETGTAVNTTGDSAATGTIDPASGYSNTSYYMDYNGGSGITSEYGAPIMNSNSAPVNDVNMPLTFAAASNANTPAGQYSATLNLIATGEF